MGKPLLLHFSQKDWLGRGIILWYAGQSGSYLGLPQDLTLQILLVFYFSFKVLLK